MHSSMSFHSAQFFHHLHSQDIKSQASAGGSVLKNTPTNAGDMSSMSGLEGPHMPRCK